MSELTVETTLSNVETTKKQKSSTKGKTTKKSSKKDIQETVEIIQNEEPEKEEQILNNKVEEEINIQVFDDTNQLSEQNSDVVEDVNKDVAIDDSVVKEEYLKHLDLILEGLTFINDKNLKEINLTKDFFTQVTTKCKKIIKLNTQMTTNIVDIMLKENLVSLKNKDSKQNKPKKVVNKENLAINKLMTTYPEVLAFLKLEDGTQVSRALLIQRINSFVKKEKTDKNPDITVAEDNRRFNLIGDLKILFDFIKLKMIERGELKDEFPTHISYREIMKYLRYCFPV